LAELKTQKTDASVDAFIDSIENAARRRDCRAVCELMREITGEEPAMWGTSMVGFGSYHYKYASGREGDWFLTGFASRKDSLTMYIMAGFSEYEALLSRLGKHKTGKACLYVKTLDDIDLGTLRELIERSVEQKRSSGEGE
jgi:hypothetical protein